MMTVSQIPDTNILEMNIEGKITPQEFDAALEKARETIAEHGKIRVLERIGEIGTPPIPWNKFWDDLKFGYEHLSDITHAAVVADQAWIRNLTGMMNPLYKAELKCFKLAEIELAREWLKTAE